MKKNLPIILNVVMCVLLLICLIKISDMQSQLDRLKRDTTGRLQNIENEMYNITYDIRRELENEASLLANSSWEFGDVNFDAHTVTVHCEISPKEYSPEETVATLILSEGTYPMTLENGVYAADVRISLFDEAHVEAVTFTEGNTIRTEQLDWYLNPRYDYLAQVYADYSGSVRGGIEDSVKNPEVEIYKVTYDGEINVNVEQKGNEDAMVSIRLLETIDGKIITDRDLPLDNGVAVTDNGLEADQGADHAIRGGSGYYYFVVRHSAEIPFGSVYDMYVEVEDSRGICHRELVHHESVDKNGKQLEVDWEPYYGYEETLYDKEGNLLYKMDESLYR